MSTTEDSIEFTPAELRQLLTYLADREREGWYYGRKDYFEKRHQSIKAKLEDRLNKGE